MNIFTNIKGFFNPNLKLLKTADDIVRQINDYESEVSKMSDEELKKSTQYFRDKLPREVTKEDLIPLIPEVFARVREAAKRVANHRHFDVQLIAGFLLAHNVVIEVFTGEGKTNIAPLSVFLYGLAGKGVHVVTVNDYLAKRDGEWVGHILDALGMSLSIINPDKSYKFVSDKQALELKDKDEVSVLLKEKDLTNMASLRGANLIEVDKKEAYLCDVCYGTSSEFGFDYLRDNMVNRLSEKVQRGFYFSIVDEADSILIDEARTPLIISAPASKSNELYSTFANLVKVLKKDEDYTLDEKEKNVFLTEDGIKKVENMMGVKNLWENFEYAHHLENALKAEVLFKLDDNYIIRDGEVLIVDEFTGRVLPGRRYSEGLHQAIEAKEGVEIKKESKTMATISYQNYFRLYKYLSGMTGTAITEAEEFADIYKVDVVVVPTYKPIIRKDYPDVIYKNEIAKFRAVVDEIESMNKVGRPVLVGTTSIEKSEFLSKQLQKKGIKHEVLNAKQHEREAHIVANAGQLGAVTVATNMAGRGTDIKLGNGVKELGGLHIIGTERHEARRVDNQLRGRSGRLGDPGSSRFYVSLEDELMRRFGGDIMHSMFNSLGVDENMPIEASMIARAIQSAQKKVENVNFEIRKHLVEYDDVLNNHRNIIYSLRDKLLDLLDKEAELHANIINSGKSLSQNYAEVSFDLVDFELLGNFLEDFSLLGENWGVNGINNV
ncbi:MAG TPA: preprotein translocase subunit SecA, partial [Candidatus Dojkabacteria bacterium]|nr:preprotein translocase subunit SecA [Candidatus Dojkabacteria bacterium]